MNDDKQMSEDVTTLSDSASKIAEGFKKTIQMADEAEKRFNEKKESAKKSFMCKTCRFESKTMKGMNAHFKKSKKCKGDIEEITNIEIDTSDRKLGGDVVGDAQKAAIEATRDIREEFSKSAVNGKKITVVDLSRCPTAALETMLKKSDESEIKKFVSMRFHPSNASRKLMAEKELLTR